MSATSSSTSGTVTQPESTVTSGGVYDPPEPILTKTEATVETDLNTAAALGSMVAGPIGGAVASGVTAGEAVVNSIIDSQQTHQSALQTAVTALSTALTVAPTVANSADPAIAAKVTQISTASRSFLQEIEAFFGDLGIKF